MKRFFLPLAIVMTVFTLTSMCAVGTWSVWYPWPPPKHGSFGDFQTAIWYTWIWVAVVPTVLVDYFVWIYGTKKNWWS